MQLELIIATYNRVGLLKDCLESVLKARVPVGLDVTVWVVDNNSTDGTKKLVSGYLTLGSGKKFRYIFAGRPGKAAALNDAIGQTSGELVGFIDDDEQLDSAWFETLYKEFSADPALGFIGGPYLGNFEHKPPSWLPNLYNGAVGVQVRPEETGNTVTRQMYREGNPGQLMGGNAVIRRPALEQVLPYPETLGKIGSKIRSGEDEVVYHRLLSAGIKGMVVPELIIYHWVPSSRMTKKYYRKWVVGRGIAQGFQLRERGFFETALLGVPRYRFRVAAASLLMLVHYSRRKRLVAQLNILDCFSVLYGFHFSK